ncbi:MAG: TIGR00730 family Rossman fold protein [Gammaproteobacteria bacterium]
MADHPTPDQAQRVRTLLDSPAYRSADGDIEYLSGDDARGIRLLLDYQKPESLMRQQGIVQTIVVFGGNRIAEPEVARRKVEQCSQRLAANPDNKELQHQFTRAQRLLEKSHYYTTAMELGRLVGGHQQVTLMTGGGPGIMEAANRGADAAGAKSIGLNITLPEEQTPNPYITPGLCFSFHYFATRKLHFLLRARALVAFPGGYGTLDELMDTLTLIQTKKIAPLPVVLVGKSYWQQVLNIAFLVDEGVINPEDAELVWYAETADEIWQGILDWHANNGTPLTRG